MSVISFGARQPATDAATLDADASSHGFTAEVARLLQLMAHSVYSERDVFLRGLVSRAGFTASRP